MSIDHIYLPAVASESCEAPKGPVVGAHHLSHRGARITGYPSARLPPLPTIVVVSQQAYGHLQPPHFPSQSTL